MPNLQSAKKALRQSKRRYERNRRVKMRLKRWLKKFEGAVASKKLDEAKKMLPFVQKLVDKAAKRNVIHKNKARRIVSRLYARLNG